MFGSIKKIFLVGLKVLPCVNPLSASNQACKVRPEIINVNSNEPLFYLFNIKTSKCSVAVTMSMIHMQKFVFLML